MERRTKLAGGYLGLCCAFMVFMRVSSVAFYNPREYIKEISTLLQKLLENLNNPDVRHIKVQGPKRSAMEHYDDCVGTFLDIFKHGINYIGGNIPSAHSVTKSIDDCVTKLNKDCKLLQAHNVTCNAYTSPKDDVDFVDLFREFSNCTGTLGKCCKYALNQEYNGDEEEHDSDHPICGHP